MFRARNATARLFHRSQSTFRLDGWVFIAECRAGLNRGPGVCACTSVPPPFGKGRDALGYVMHRALPRGVSAEIWKWTENQHL